MKLLLIALSGLVTLSAIAQRSDRTRGRAESNKPRPVDIGAMPQEIGAENIAWYTTWESALTEAQRTNRPIFFFAAAAQCSAISGIF